MRSNIRVPNAPIAPSDRILGLDVLRGFGVLGILVMNIPLFAMPEMASLNPTAYGDFTGLNRWVWVLSHIFADLKFISIFLMLFGAGIVLMTSKVEAKRQSAVGLYYRRTLWLIVIGMLHAYLLWYGDILVMYGICALVIFPFRKVAPKWLLTIGLITTLVASLLSLLGGWSLPFWPREAYEQMVLTWKPTQVLIRAEIAAYQGGWLEQMAHRVPAAFEAQTFLFLIFYGWRAAGLMLVGMALLKWRVLTGQRSRRFYLALMAGGFAIGLPLIIYGVDRNFAASWSLDYSMFFGDQFNYWGSLFVALGYTCMVMLICKSRRLKKAICPLAAVGRMALTNYLLQTVICTTVFYGHGLGLFGRVERSEQMLIVFGVWAFSLVASPIWLRFFRFGPAEWLWRSLTYRKLQPMRCRTLKPSPHANSQTERRRPANQD